MEQWLVFLLLFIVVLVILLGRFIYKKNNLDKENVAVEETLPSANENEAANQIFSVELIDNKNTLAAQEKTKVKLNGELKANLEQVIKPNVSTAKRAVKKDEWYKLIFSPETLKKIRRGDLKLSDAAGGAGKRAAAVDAKNKISENARLMSVSKTSLITNAAMGVLTTVTSQEHLRQIGNEIKSLNGKVDKVIHSINNKLIGDDRGNISYLLTLQGTLMNGDFSNEEGLIYKSKLESIYKETLQDLETIKTGIEETTNKFNITPKKGIINANIEITNIEEIVSDYEQQMKHALRKLEVILFCLKFSKFLNSNYSVDESRTQRLKAELENLERMYLEYEHNLKNYVEQLNVWVRHDKKKYIENLKDRVGEQHKEVIERHRQNEIKIIDDIKKVESEEYEDILLSKDNLEFEVAMSSEGEVKDMRIIN